MDPFGEFSQWRQVDDVIVEIDYAIIEHFSKNLYGSPNKAVEELVANGFDALASTVHVYIPGRFTTNRVIVWDDGISMSQEDLHRLWWIAKSPKAEGNPDRIATTKDGERTRAMIGKFGIGKLASYVVGERLTHVCRQGDQFLTIAVDSRKAPALEHRISQAEGAGSKEPFITQIFRLTEEQAQTFVESQFRELPATFADLWNSRSWTIAVIDQLKEGVELSQGRVSWVIGNGMPLRPDFSVTVNDTPVESKLAKGAFQSWDLTEELIRQTLAGEWQAARKQGLVEGEFKLVEFSVEGQEPTLRLPALGDVRAEVHLFDRSLHVQKSSDTPRSYGFFVMVRDRLLNPEDAKLAMSDPSFGTFYRCQYVIHADGLDQDLLADRERVQMNTPRARELAVLRDSLYLASRQALEAYDEHTIRQQSSAVLLPVDSRELFRAPMAALLTKLGKTSGKPFDPAEAARIDRAPLGSASPISTLRNEGLGFIVNTTHPLLGSVAERLGGGQKAREALRALDLFAVSERLMEGFLYDLGVGLEEIDRILEWREGVLRAMALRYAAVPAEDVISEVLATSFTGGKLFEEALAQLFQLMGFETERDGVSGRKDVLVVAPVGKKQFRLTVEAKGSNAAVANDGAEISVAAAHRDQVNADLAVVVAREFRGFDQEREGGAMILHECRSVGKVAIATVETLIELHGAVKSFHYSLESLLPILSVVESPQEKLQRVKALQSPTMGFDYRGVLNSLWRMQQEEAEGDMVPYRTLWQEGPERWSVSLEDFVRRLAALETLSNYLVEIEEPEKAVILHQRPDIVIDQIQSAVDARTDNTAIDSL